MTTGDRVILRGRVEFVRNGFVQVEWANGNTTVEWEPDLELDATEGEE